MYSGGPARCRPDTSGAARGVRELPGRHRVSVSRVRLWILLCVRLSGAQKVSLKLLILPTSAAARSWTLSFQAPLATSEEAFTVNVWMMLSAEPPLRVLQSE